MLNAQVERKTNDEFCPNILAQQSLSYDSAFCEDRQGRLTRRHPRDQFLTQIVVPETFHSLLLGLGHFENMTGLLGQTRMYESLRPLYYWPHMSADIHSINKNCQGCARNRLGLRLRTNPMQCFPATELLQRLVIDLRAPLTRTNKENGFILMISDRFTKLTNEVTLRGVNSYTVAVDFTSHWIYYYGPPESVIYTSTYHSQTNR